MNSIRSYVPIIVLIVLVFPIAIVRQPLAAVHKVASSSSVQPTDDDYIALYRLNNVQTKDHIYTRACEELKSLIKSSGYRYEGIAGYIAASQSPNTVPLYRLTLGTGEHFYTTNEVEVKSLAQDSGNKLEGITGYIASSQLPNTAAFYRLISDDRHFYTANEQEKNRYLQFPGNRLEGSIGYVWQSGLSPCDEGILIEKRGKPGIWRIENGKKRLFPNMCTFRTMYDRGELGEKYVYTLDDPIIDAIPNGDTFSNTDFPLKEGQIISHKGSISRIEGGKRRLYPDLCTYRAMGVGDATELNDDIFSCIPVGSDFPKKSYTCSDAPCCTSPISPPIPPAGANRLICRGSSIPNGWVIIVTWAISSNCPGTDLYREYTIRDTAPYSIGNILVVCGNSPIPSGWRVESTSAVSTDCPAAGSKVIVREK